MLLMEDVTAAPLSESLSSPRLAEHLRMAARALGKLHTCPLRVDRQYQMEEQIATLKWGVSKAIQVCPDLAGLLAQRLGGILESAHALRCDFPVLVHQDFQYNQVLIGSDTVTIIDLDTLCNGDAALDLGNFLAHLKWKSLQLGWTEEEVRRHAATFLSGYRLSIPAELMRRIGLYYRPCLLRLACLVARRPPWRHLAAALLDEGEQPCPA
jgi:Ser/Thr protein kinase RdoA (MazF antagonist)